MFIVAREIIVAVLNERNISVNPKNSNILGDTMYAYMLPPNVAGMLIKNDIIRESLTSYPLRRRANIVTPLLLTPGRIEKD
jgi:hypothetical protein